MAAGHTPDTEAGDVARRLQPRGRTTPLTRDEIITTAMAVAERGALDTLTMRGLARDLGVTAMALYAHVANKDDILDEIIDRVLDRDAMPVLERGGDWKAWTLEAANRLRAVLMRFPALLDRYCRRPVGVPAALRRMETSLEVLRGAGFDDEACVAAYTSIHTYTLGFTALEIARETSRRHVARGASVRMSEASPHYWPAFFAGLSESEYPNLTRLRPDLAELTSDSHFREGLLTVLEGLDRRPRVNAV